MSRKPPMISLPAPEWAPGRPLRRKGTEPEPRDGARRGSQAGQTGQGGVGVDQTGRVFRSERGARPGQRTGSHPDPSPPEPSPKELPPETVPDRQDGREAAETAGRSKESLGRTGRPESRPSPAAPHPRHPAFATRPPLPRGAGLQRSPPDPCARKRAVVEYLDSHSMSLLTKAIRPGNAGHRLSSHSYAITLWKGVTHT